MVGSWNRQAPTETLLSIRLCTSLADPRGAPGMRVPPPLGPIFFIFMQFSVKIDQNNRLAPPPLGFAPLPLGNPGSATVHGP